MSDAASGPVLAAEISAGVGGFLVVFLLVLASIALFVFLSGSLRRMRANVERGEFGSADRDRKAGGGAPDVDADSPDGSPAAGERDAADVAGARAEVPAQPKRSGGS